VGNQVGEPLSPEREDSASGACAPLRHGSGEPSGPFFGTSGTRISGMKVPGWRGVHSSGKCSNLSIAEACGEIRRPEHNRDSARSLPTFLANSPSPHVWRTRNGWMVGYTDHAPNSRGRHGTTVFQLNNTCAVNMNTKVIRQVMRMARKSESIPRWCSLHWSDRGTGLMTARTCPPSCIIVTR
jgi:hypothetical protein